MDLPRPAPARMDLLNDIPSAEKTYSAPKVQAPSAKPLPSTPEQPFPPLFHSSNLWHQLSCVNASAIISQVLSKKVCLSVKELLALAPKVKKHFKETTTMKRLPALPAEVQAVAAHYLLDGHESWASCGQAETTTPDDWGYIGWHCQEWGFQPN